MSEAQLTALLAKLNDDAGLREKLQASADLDAALALGRLWKTQPTCAKIGL
jgi:hypothetical protein